MNISKKKILLVSSVRSGSTALGECIKQLIFRGNCYFFEEPDSPYSKEGPAYWLSKVDSLIIDSKLECFIIKIVQHKLNTKAGYSEKLLDYLLNSNEVLRIRLSRKDVLSQITSYYIAEYRNKTEAPKFNGYWHFDNKKTYDNLISKIPKNEKDAILSIKHVLNDNKELSNSTVKFDIDVYYEDIQHLLPKTKWIKTPEPDNYQEIKEFIEVTYKNYLNTSTTL